MRFLITIAIHCIVGEPEQAVVGVFNQWHLTHVVSTVLGWATYYDSRAIIWVWLHEQHTLLCLLFYAYPVCVLLLRLLFQQRGALSYSIDIYFSPPLFVESFAEHINNTTVPYWTPPKLHINNTMVPYQLPLTLRNPAVKLPRNTQCHEFSDFSQCEYHYSTSTNVFMVQHTNTDIQHTYIHAYIHAYIQTPLAFNTIMWGSLRLAPIMLHFP